MGRTVKIFDTTLRDGEQSPGCSMNLNEKIEVAKQLEALKVDIIEAGFAAASPGDAAAIAAIADTVRGATICSLARCREQDIEAAWNSIRRAESARIHTFLATSPVHMEYKLKMTPDEVLESVAHNVAFAKKFCSDIEFSAEDATRSDLDFLCRVVRNRHQGRCDHHQYSGYGRLYDPGGVCIPHPAICVSIPPGIENIVLSCHMHNDLGMAVANSLAGVEAGIDQIECTINGIGERAGNASMEECVMALKTRADHFRHRLQHRDHPDLPCKPHDPDHHRRFCCTDQADRRCKCVRTRGGHPSARCDGKQGDLRDHDSGIRRHPEERHRARQAFRPPCVRGAPA